MRDENDPSATFTSHLIARQTTTGTEKLWIVGEGGEFPNFVSAFPTVHINHVCGGTLLFIGQKTVLVHSCEPPTLQKQSV